MKIYALHGFFGIPQDWEIIRKGKLFKELKAVDLLSYSVDSLVDWAEQFNHCVRKDASNTKKCLLGYSLGGRLALHCLLQDPSLWSAAILVSAHCGLVQEEKKKERVAADEKWAERFETIEWQQLFKEWNAQEIFIGSVSLNRKESNFSRKQLAAMLRGFSVGKQANLSSHLSSLQLPILWLTGEDDVASSTVAKNVHLKDPLSRIRTIPRAGHRLVWDQPERFLAESETFLNRVIKHGNQQRRAQILDND